jgi:N-acetylneuraminic acid mutarotase
MKKLFRSVVPLLFTLIAVFTYTSAHAQGRWVKLARFPSRQKSCSAPLRAASCMYSPAWRRAGNRNLLVYEYDPATDKWAKKKPMALASHHVAIAEHNGKIYAFGGFVLPASGPAAWQPVDNAYEYDPAADSWKALAPMPTKRGRGGRGIGRRQTVCDRRCNDAAKFEGNIDPPGALPSFARHG